MNSFINKFIDRWVIRSATKRMARLPETEANADQAERLLQSPDFFGENTPPAAITFTGGKNFEFPSPVKTKSPENNLVRGRLTRCGKHWRQRSTVILLHGWNDNWGYRNRLPAIAHILSRRGINSLMFELPYHHQRLAERVGISTFLSGDLGRTVEAAHQSLAEISALTGWVLQQGCPRVAIWGNSLGGWLAGMATCHDARLTGAVLFTPLSRVDRFIAETPFCEVIRRSLEKRPVDMTRLNLTSHKTKLPRSHLLIVQAEDDLFVPANTTEELWEAWDKPEHWQQAHGHITILGSGSLNKRASKWVGLRLKLPTNDGPAITQDQVLQDS